MIPFDRWTQGANLPEARGALNSNFINGELYVIGGVNSTETLKSNLAYDPVSNK
jgi:Kelch motif